MKFSLLLAIAFQALAQSPAQVPAHTRHYPNTSNATVLYGAMGVVPPPIWPTVNRWMSQRFDLVLGGGEAGDAHGGNLTQTYWATYTDIAVGELRFIYGIQANLAAAGMDYEGAILHSSIDMRWAPSLAAQNVGRFDIFEMPFNGNMVQGVFTYSGGVYADVTNSLYAGTPTAIANTIYFGYQVPFDQANFSMATPRAGGSVAYNYWNGTAWTPLTNHFSDTTNGLTTSGKVYFYPPSDWSARTLPVKVATPQPITVTHSKYWLQVVVTGASTPPVISGALTDNWAVASGSNNARGWDGAASGRINIGTPLEYNPSPPSISTAKFKYQSRVPVSNAGQNYYWGNPSNMQGGRRSFAKVLQYLIDSQTDNFDSAFFDDGGRYPGGSGGISIPIYPTSGWLTYMDFNHGSGSDLGFVSEQMNIFTETSNNLKAESKHGSNYWVGTNSPLPGTPAGSASVGDFTFIEAFVTPSPLGYCNYVSSLNGGANIAACPYDWALPGSSNPANVKFFFQSLDGWDYQFPWYGGAWTAWHYPDHGNRTPMSLLAQHYIGANVNTGFMYYGTIGSTSGINYYFATDQVYTYGAQLTTTSSITADLSTGAKTITLNNSNGCTPAYQAGHNMFRIGTKSLGDTVGGSIGRVYDFGGNDLTGALRQGDMPTKGGGYPSNLYAGDSAKFGSLTISVATPVVGGKIAWSYWNGTAWRPLSVRDGTGNFNHNGTVTWTPPSDWAASASVGNAPYGALTIASGYYIQMQTYSPFSLLTLYSGEWNTLTIPAAPGSTTSSIYNSYPAGTPVYCIGVQHLSVTPAPAAGNVYAWSRWFPAMGVDIGVPNPSGIGGGLRMVDGTPVKGVSLPPWKYGGAPDKISGQKSCPSTGPKCANLWRRDFTNAIVLYRPWAGSGTPTPILESEIDTYSKTIDLGGTYYPLAADGTTGSGVSSVQLRAGEGAILMTTAIVASASSGSAIRGGVVSGANIR